MESWLNITTRAKMSSIILILNLICVLYTTSSIAQYQPNWESLDSRPLPSWYDEAKIGIFIHWGVFSVPGFGSEWFWYSWRMGDPSTVKFMKDNFPPGFTYADFASMFKAEFFNPDQWADIFKASGAKYIVLTSKHCEGFTNWPSKLSFNWNSVDVGPNRDLVGDLMKAVRQRTDLRFGLYHAWIEWFHPLWLQDFANKYKTNTYATSKPLPELYELVNMYKPDLIWADADGLGYAMPPDTYWNSTGFLAWLYNESPVKDYVVTNDRYGDGIPCHHGGYWTCGDGYNPRVLQKHKWENCMTIDRYSWGYRRNARYDDFRSPAELIQILAETVSCGGNMLMNIGPTADGMISPLFEERLRQFGDWLRVNGDAIYSSKPWTHQNDTVTTDVWYTSRKLAMNMTVYAIVLQWPKSGILTLGAVHATSTTTVRMLGYASPFHWTPRSAGGIDVFIPVISEDEMPCDWAWVFKLDNLA